MLRVLKETVWEGILCITMHAVYLRRMLLKDVHFFYL